MPSPPIPSPCHLVPYIPLSSALYPHPVLALYSPRPSPLRTVLRFALYPVLKLLSRSALFTICSFSGTLQHRTLPKYKGSSQQTGAQAVSLGLGDHRAT